MLNKFIYTLQGYINMKEVLLQVIIKYWFLIVKFVLVLGYHEKIVIQNLSKQEIH